MMREAMFDLHLKRWLASKTNNFQKSPAKTNVIKQISNLKHDKIYYDNRKLVCLRSALFPVYKRSINTGNFLQTLNINIEITSGAIK